MTQNPDPGPLTLLSSRCAAALGGSAAGGLCAALADALIASRAGEGPSASALLLPALALVAPLALVLGLVAGVGAFLFLPREFPRFRPQGHTPELRFAWLVTPPALCLGTLFLGRPALALLSANAEAGPTGAVLSLAALSIWLGSALPALGLSRVLSRRFPDWRLSVAGSAVIGVSLAFTLLYAAVRVGTTSGTGQPLALFGVFERPELDLKGPGLAVLPLVFALLVPPLAAPRARVAALALGVLPLSFTLAGSGAAFDAPSVALTIERAAPLGKRLLPVARKLSDRDRDGFAARFGGGDCAEGDARRNPGADDVPGNALDEDCSGADAKPFVAAAPSAAAPADAGAAARAKLPQQPNIVLITVDTLRYDLGYLGYERKVSPNIDQLAAKSVVFERAYALASYTSKSLPPMLIGKYGSETHRGFLHFNRFLDQRDVFLAERLKSQGFQTISVQGHWYFAKGYGLDRGFDVLDTSGSPRAAQAEGDRTSTSEKLTDAALARLAAPELERGQFFLWVHYTDPHAEYVPHEGFDFGKSSRDLYDSEVAFVDHHVGRLLAGLAARPFADRTIVMLTSDHGEAFGEHGMIRHGFELWEELVRVPLIVHVPSLPAARVKERRSTIDLVPTVLDLVGAKLPPRGAPDALSGTSLVPDLLLAPNQAPAPRPVFVDMAAGPHNAERQAFIENDLKLTISAGRPLGLYDLAQDPGEKKDLLSDRARAAEALERAKAFRRTLREVRVRAE